MTACPACKGTGRWPTLGRHLSLVTDPPCKACGGTGRLSEVLLAMEPRCPSCGGAATHIKGPNPLGGEPIDIYGCSKCCPRDGGWFLVPHGVGCPCEECQKF